jgi:hypothetical protein
MTLTGIDAELVRLNTMDLLPTSWSVLIGGVGVILAGSIPTAHLLLPSFNFNLFARHCEVEIRSSARPPILDILEPNSSFFVGNHGRSYCRTQPGL